MQEFCRIVLDLSARRFWAAGAGELHSQVQRRQIPQNRNVRHSCTCSSAIYFARKHKSFLRSPTSMTANAVEIAPTTADFKSLEEKILRTIELLKSARDAKAVAERDASRLRTQLNEREEELDTVRQELVALRREREEVRTRVEKMLGQIESLALEESAG